MDKATAILATIEIIEIVDISTTQSITKNNSKVGNQEWGSIRLALLELDFTERNIHEILSIASRHLW